VWDLVDQRIIDAAVKQWCNYLQAQVRAKWGM